MLYDSVCRLLITAKRCPAALLHMPSSSHNTSHVAPLCAALYNTYFHVVRAPVFLKCCSIVAQLRVEI